MDKIKITLVYNNKQTIEFEFENDYRKIKRKINEIFNINFEEDTDVSYFFLNEKNEEVDYYRKKDHELFLKQKDKKIYVINNNPNKQTVEIKLPDLNQTTFKDLKKIFLFDENKSISQFDLNSPTFNDLKEKLEEKNIFKSEIYALENRELIEINNENYNKYKEFIILKIEELTLTSSQFILENLDETNQENLIEKTTCSLCQADLNEKPYYCYNCSKIFCSKCFEDKRAFKRLTKIQCEKCKKISKHNKVICDNNCKLESKNEYIECTYCKFCLDKSNWHRLRDFDRNREYLENKENLKKEIIILYYEYKYNKLNEEIKSNKTYEEINKLNEENNKIKNENEEIKKKNINLEKEINKLIKLVNKNLDNTYEIENIINKDKNLKEKFNKKIFHYNEE